MDTFGALSLPIAAAGAPIGDPGLGTLASFCAAVLNADAQAAWTALFPRPSDARLQPVVRRTFTHAPVDGGWLEHDLPALFVHRERGRQQDATFGYRTESATFRLSWVFPKDDQLKHGPRAALPRGLMAALGAALYAQRHPAWTSAADAPGEAGADPRAASLPADPDAFALERSTSTSIVTLTGASLDGALAGETLTPRRGVSVTTSAAAGAYSTASPVLVTYLDWQGREQVGNVELTSANGGETVTGLFEAASVTSVTIPAQATTGGTISVGAMAREGIGSQLLVAAGFMRCSLDDWQPSTVNVEVLDDEAGQRVSRVIRYQAVQATISATEQHVLDPAVAASLLATSPAGLDLDVVIDGYVATRAELDGAPSDS